METKVLYEDNHIIAVYKPSGVLTQGDKSGKRCLMDAVKEYLKEKYQKPGNVFLGLVHRLDKPVSGIVLFGKTSKGSARLSEQFRNHSIKKVYHGIVMGKLKEQKGEIKEKVKKIAFFAKGLVDKDEKELLEEIKKATKTRTAELSYEVLDSNDKYSLVKIMPKTGRFHQIRIQMANLGNPVVGDVKYGAPFPLKDRSIALSANSISFKLATKDETKTISIPPVFDLKNIEGKI
ncbi:MAG: RNA pseudouridine synthase [bacterium]|nr:RNA pseudouridine synthase [bacterium]